MTETFRNSIRSQRGTFPGMVMRGLRHTRWVPSGSPPLYRLMVVGVILSGLVQCMNGEAPISVRDNSFDWFDYLFITSTLGSGLVILTSLYMIDGNRYSARGLRRSLEFERFGLIGLQTCIAASVLANGLFNKGIPPGLGTWFTIMFWFWAWSRMWEIRKHIKMLTCTEHKKE